MTNALGYWYNVLMAFFNNAFKRNSAMYVIVGLGNPGRKYEHSRHNVGFDVVEVLSQKCNIPVAKLRCKAIVGEGVICGKRVTLCKPQTYMNLSGESVVQLSNWYKPEHDQLIICYDDTDLPEGKLRFRESGSAGTHNGMKNIVYLLGRDDIPRVRVGIGRPPEEMDLKDYVLTGYNTPELRNIMFEAYIKAADMLIEYIKGGADAVRLFMSRG